MKLTCNLDGADVFINGNLIGQTPIPKKLAVNPGWHRVKVIDPNAPPPQFSMAVPDYQDIYESICLVFQGFLRSSCRFHVVFPIV